jgi:hypothetical protein
MLMKEDSSHPEVVSPGIGSIFDFESWKPEEMV